MEEINLNESLMTQWCIFSRIINIPFFDKKFSFRRNAVLQTLRVLFAELGEIDDFRGK